MILELLVVLVLEGGGVSLAHISVHEVLDDLEPPGVLWVEMVWSAEFVFNVLTLFWTIDGGKGRFERKFI